MNTTIKCSNPTVILHPYAKSYFHKCSNFCYNGILYNLHDANFCRFRDYSNWYKHFVSPFFKSYKVHPEFTFTQDSLFDLYHFIGNDGVCYPMYIIVPCGKCSVCSHTRLNDISSRCVLETYTSKCSPLFVTLTYNNENLPQDGSVSLRDIQNFLKLLRINLNRFFQTKISLRYLYASEYTPNNHRPHYHLLIWNVPYFPDGLSHYQKNFLNSRLEGYPDFKTPFVNTLDLKNYTSKTISGNISFDLGRIRGYETLKRLIWCSWKKGFIKCEVSNDPSGRYVAKYIGKGSDVPKGKLPTFIRWSTRRGLGFDAFDKEFRDILLKNPSLTQLTFMDPKSGKLQKVSIPKYYRSLLAPSLSIVSKPFRNTLESFHHYYCVLKDVSKFYWHSDYLNKIAVMHSHVYNKFNLFSDLCGLSVPLRSDDTSYCKMIDDINNSLYYNRNRAHTILSHVLNAFYDSYDELMDFDIDSLHLQDIIDYKLLSQLARADFAKKNPHTIEYYKNKASDSFNRLHSRAISNDFVLC